MKRQQRMSTRGHVSTAVFAVLLLASQGVPAAEPLTLRINDTTTLSGGIAAVTLRTYASRPIGQGQICFQFAARSAVKGGTQGPIAAVEGATVFSVTGDAVETVIFDGSSPAQPTMVSFSSASATINATDGPLAVVFLRMHDGLAPGTEYDILLDLPNTDLYDPEGKPIAVETRDGTITIRDPAAPVEVVGAAEATIAGEVALVSMQTREQFAIQSGQVGLRYNPSLAPDWIKVSMDPRYGAAEFDTSISPGLVLVTFSSPDASLNTVPGDLVTVKMPTQALGTRPVFSSVVLDPALTFLWDAQGQVIETALESDVLVISPGPVYEPAKPRPPGTVLRRR